MRVKSDRRVAEGREGWIGEGPAGQSRSSFGMAPGQEVMSQTEGIGESPVRVYVLVARRYVEKVLLFGKTLGEVCDLPIANSPRMS